MQWLLEGLDWLPILEALAQRWFWQWCLPCVGLGASVVLAILGNAFWPFPALLGVLLWLIVRFVFSPI